MAKKRFMGINPKHKGYCTPMTKSTCTPRRKALARTLKKHHGFHKQLGGTIKTEQVETKTMKMGGNLPKRKLKKPCNC